MAQGRMEPTLDIDTQLYDAAVAGVTPTRGLLGEGQGQDFEEYADRYGRVRLWHFGNCVGVLESSGGITDAHAQFIVRYYDTHVSAHGKPRYAVCNWLALTAYTTEVRKTLTDWQRKQMYEGVYVAQSSKLLAMSVSVANAVLDREIRTYATLSALQVQFELTLREHGLTDLLSRSSHRGLRPTA